jgi:16S rRNA (guanine527-N7)-methyltransferase
VKAVAAELGLRVRGTAVRAAGRPDREGLPRADAAVSRALAEPRRWVELGSHYLAAGGRLFAMLGREVSEGELFRIGAENGLELEALARFALPLSGAQRAIARYRRGGPVPRGT